MPDSKTLIVYRPGSEVDLGQGLKGTINQAAVAARGHVRYEVVWWIGNDRKCEWLEEHEILSVPVADMLRIGFTQEEGK